MPILSNPQHEEFANAVAKGEKPREAYISAGYSPRSTDACASRLLKHAKVAARIAELKTKVAERTSRAISFEAKQLFADLIQDIEDAKAAKDFKAAMDGRKFLIRCFGYEDSPTLTHEKVLGEKIPVANHQQEGGEQPEEQAPATNVMAFTAALKKYANRK